MRLEMAPKSSSCAMVQQHSLRDRFHQFYALGLDNDASVSNYMHKVWIQVFDPLFFFKMASQKTIMLPSILDCFYMTESLLRQLDWIWGHQIPNEGPPQKRSYLLTPFVLQSSITSKWVPMEDHLEAYCSIESSLLCEVGNSMQDFN